MDPEVSIRLGNLDLFLRAPFEALDVSLIFYVKVNPDPEADSVLSPAAGDFWTNFTHFHDECGLAPEVDSRPARMLMRQPTVTFG